MGERFTDDLKRRYAKLLAEQAFLEGEKREIERQIEHLRSVRLQLDTLPEVLEHYREVILYEDPAWDPTSVVPTRMRPHRSEFSRGVISKAVWDRLKQAALLDAPISQAKIVDEITDGLTPRFNRINVLYRVARHVTQTLSYLQGLKLVVGRGTHPTLWTLAPPPAPARPETRQIAEPRRIAAPKVIAAPHPRRG
jgi:hypothetical protein